jgi:hypothetical protein
MISHTDQAGGRIRARRLFLTIAVLLAGLLPALPFAATVDSERRPTITVREEQGVYSVAARFHVMQPPPAVLAVLTDYEAIPRFMPEINTSVVLERVAGRAVVEQEAITSLMMFSKRVHLVLEISEGADALKFRDRCGRSFARYEGSWRLTEHNGQTDVLSELIAQPSFDVPEFILKRLLKRNSAQMIGQLQSEIALRSR